MTKTKKKEKDKDGKERKRQKRKKKTNSERKGILEVDERKGNSARFIFKEVCARQNVFKDFFRKNIN